MPASNKEQKRTVLMIRSSAFKTQRLVKQALELTKLGLRVRVIFWERVLLHESEVLIIDMLRSKGVEVHRFIGSAEYGTGIKSIVKRTAWLRFVFDEIKLMNPDFIHAIDLDSSLIFLVIKCRKCVIVADFADYIEDYAYKFSLVLRPLIRILTFLVYKRSDYVVLPSSERKKFYMKRVYVVNNAPKGSYVANDGGFKREGRWSVLYCGTYGKDRAIDILCALSEDVELDKFRFEIAGWGELQSLVDRYSKIQNYGHITYLSVLEKTQNTDFVYCVYDPLIPVNRFADPNKFYEAVLMGKPLIVAKGTGIDLIVEKYGLGLVVDYSFSSVKAQLKLVNDQMYAEFVQNVRKARPIFSWAESVKSLVSIYQ